MKNDIKDKLSKRQFRQMKPLEIRAISKGTESSFLVEGYAMRYEPYKLFEDMEGPVYEEFRREAFDNTDLSDVIMLYDHQGKVFARTSNNTLNISLDEEGMYIKADLSKSEASREMFNEIKQGLVTKMSWSFDPGFEGKNYYFDQDKRTLVYKDIPKVYDVSAVGIPANDSTVINARSFVNGVIDKAKTERSKEQAKRKKIELLIKLNLEG